MVRKKLIKSKNFRLDIEHAAINISRLLFFEVTTMKKFTIFCLISLFALVFAVACGNESGEPEEPAIDNDPVESPEDDSEPADAEPAADEDIPEVTDDTEPDEEMPVPDETPVPDNEPQTGSIGTFALNFAGDVVTQISLQTLKGGEGSVQFSINGNPINYGDVDVPLLGRMLPLTISQNNQIMTFWLDGISMADLQGSATHQGFGIMFPANVQAPFEGDLASANAYAFHGDVTVAITSGGFNVDCVRAVTNAGTLSVTAYDGASITYTANGELYDPAIASSSLPYPPCQN